MVTKMITEPTSGDEIFTFRTFSSIILTSSQTDSINKVLSSKQYIIISACPRWGDRITHLYVVLCKFLRKRLPTGRKRVNRIIYRDLSIFVVKKIEYVISTFLKDFLAEKHRAGRCYDLDARLAQKSRWLVGYQPNHLRRNNLLALPDHAQALLSGNLLNGKRVFSPQALINELFSRAS